MTPEQEENLRKASAEHIRTVFGVFEFCIKCKWFDNVLWNCPAFPNDIPVEILDKFENHDKVIPGQRGSTIFEPREDRSK